ncbi:MAG: hypothetical protein CMC04_05725 [Flavobacteriaceae bacterium]|nr:hypothetical protein [Flavobacteriaceae bacterium]
MIKISLKNNFFFYSSLFFIILLSSIISYNNISFDLYFNNKYRDYSNYFLSLLKGIENTGLNNLNTFPLWGYGFIHLIFNSKIKILIFQQLLNFITIVKVDQFLISEKKIKKIILSRTLMLLSLPYFFFHTQMWPKSVSSSLLIFSILQLFYFLENKKKYHLLISGIFMGVLCNFRSDYFFMICVLPFLLLIWEFYKSRNITFISLRLFLIPLITFFFLIPWGVYTYLKTDHFILNSTNTGHTFFIGLGQLPDNKWGITPRDDDKLMKDLLKVEFKDKDVSSVSFTANKFLINEFKRLVLEDPVEWIKKCFYSFRLLLLDPFYVGNVGNFQKNKISNIQEIRNLESAVYRFKFKESYKIVANTKWLFSKKEIFQLIITILTKLIGLSLFFCSLIIILYSFLKIPRKIFDDGIVTSSILIIAYQVSISILAFHMPVYNTTIYLIYLVLFVLLFDKITFNQTVKDN